jgi:hypothetical protein
MTYIKYKKLGKELSHLLEVKHQRGFSTIKENKRLKTLAKLMTPYAF